MPCPQKRTSAFADLALRHILRLCQASVVFTAFDDMFLSWLESVLPIWSANEVSYTLIVLDGLNLTATNMTSLLGRCNGYSSVKGTLIPDPRQF